MTPSIHTPRAHTGGEILIITLQAPTDPQATHILQDTIA